MAEVQYTPSQGHYCKHVRRWVNAGETIPIPADLADRYVRHDLGSVSGEYTRESLEEKTVDELRDLADDDGVGLTSSMRKDAIVDAILAGPDASDEDGGSDEEPEEPVS